MAANNSKRKNIFTKYFTVISFIVFICLAVVGTFLLFFISDYWQKEKAELLSENAKSISQSMSSLIESETIEADRMQTYLLMYHSMRLISTAIDADIFICDTSGSVVVCGDSADYTHLVKDCPVHGDMQISESVLSSNLTKGQAEMTTLGGVYSTPHLTVGETVMFHGKPVAYVFATQSNSASVRPYMLDILKMFLFSALFSLIIAFIAVYILTYNMVKPLRDMSKATKAFAKGDFTYRVKVRGNDELSDLSQAFNTMAKSLGVLEASRRSFVANVSHELKTPMTTIGGFIDGILDGTIPPEKEEYYLKKVSDEIRRLSRLVMTMLNMSKIEAGELKIKPSRFDISQRIFQVLIAFEQNIDKKHIEIQGLDSMESVFVEADEDMIHQVIYNLVDNAVKFTPENGYIAVSALSGSGKVFVRIRNSGEGIASEEVSRIFERFYKVDKSRSFDVKGAGLGLYIVKSIIDMHGGQITASSKVGEYTEFVFWLPADFSGN